MLDNQKGSSSPIILVVVATVFLAIGLVAGIRIDEAGIAPVSVLDNSIERNDTIKDDVDTDKLQEVYDRLVGSYDGELDYTDLVNGSIDGLVRGAGDQHTDYLDPEQAKQFQDSLNGDLIGIGAFIGERDGFIEVQQPISGSPSEKSGLKQQDLIIEVDGRSTADMSADEAASIIRGEADTSVALKVNRGGEIIDFNVVREKISVPSVESELIEGDIAVIRLSRFEQDSKDEVEKAWSSLKGQGAQKLIFDLRNNGGGYLDSAVDISGMWLNDDQAVLIQRRGDEVIKTDRSSSESVFEGIPTVVLANRYSASASEILLGALRDNNYAEFVGEKTFGKGSVQKIYNLDDGSLIKITESHWYTPNDTKIDGDGLSPDFEVLNADSQSDLQQQKAVELLSR